MRAKTYKESDVVLHQLPGKTQIKDRTGLVRGLLEYIGYAGDVRWWCKCECGNYVKLTSTSPARSCGCLHTAAIKASNSTHGMSNKKDPTYSAWTSMNRRCDTPSSTSYPRYGALGVRVCERWRLSFENFLSDVGERPGDRYSLDRIDPHGDYEPGNVRWADSITQSRNKKNTTSITIDGIKKPLSELTNGYNNKEYFRAMYRLKNGWCDACVLKPAGAECEHKSISCDSHP